MASGDGFKLFEERVTARKQQTNAVFDPTMIFTILAAIIPLIQGCFNPTAAMLKRRPFNRARVAIALRQQDSSLTFAQAFIEADDLIDVAQEATDEELTLFIKDCKE